MNYLNDVFLMILLGVITGVISGILSCFIFWKYTLLRAPYIDISPKIAKNPQDLGNVDYHYLIKIINRWRRPAIDLHYLAQLVREEQTLNRGTRHLTRTIPLTKNYGFVIHPLDIKKGYGDVNLVLCLWNEKFLEKLCKTYAIDEKFCEKINKNIRLEDLLSKYDYLWVQVIATDPTSNIRKVFLQEFHIGDIIEGDYLSGSFEIVKTHSSKKS